MTRSTTSRLATLALAAGLLSFAPAALACGGATNQTAGTSQSSAASPTAGFKVLNVAYGADSGRKSMDIVDTAVAAGNFKTLAAALQAAGLVDTLKGAGPFTVFAPTDEAFAKLPAGTLDALLEDPKKLASILTYHVVAGRVTAKDVAGLTSATTVQGSRINIDTRDGVHINDAKVLKADIMTSNGVIHVIDSVILPPA